MRSGLWGYLLQKFFQSRSEFTHGTEKTVHLHDSAWWSYGPCTWHFICSTPWITTPLHLKNNFPGSSTTGSLAVGNCALSWNCKKSIPGTHLWEVVAGKIYLDGNRRTPPQVPNVPSWKSSALSSSSSEIGPVSRHFEPLVWPISLSWSGLVCFPSCALAGTVPRLHWSQHSCWTPGGS